MKKRIILLLDGTWNDDQFNPADSNIVRLREIISQSLPEAEAVKRTRGPKLRSGQRIVSGKRSADSVENLVFYERGVGTNAFDAFRGGALGEGLELNIRRAYRFLSFYYREGDEVFVFGFSRGAYTARSLVGYISAAGLLRQQWCTKHLENSAWKFYRTPPSDRLPGAWHYLSPYVHDRTAFSFNCIGLFDTVGALGIPLSPFRKINRQRYEFHSVDLSTNTKVNLHALALDEHRAPFEASIWRRPKFRSISSITEQVWFSGAHADIGGGYYSQDKRIGGGSFIDDISLDWMLKRIREYFPQFPINIEKAWKVLDPNECALAQHHNPRQGIYRFFRHAIRSVGNHPTNPSGFAEVEVCRDSRSDTIGEMIHISAIERLGCKVQHEKRFALYSPRNLIAALTTLDQTYRRSPLPDKVQPLYIVDWSSKRLNPSVQIDAEVALKAVESSKQRLGICQ